jgi:hypothetical protein
MGSRRPSVNKERDDDDEHTRGEANFNRLMFPPQTECCSVRRSLEVGQRPIGQAPIGKLSGDGNTRVVVLCAVLTDALIGRNQYEDAKTQSGF